MHQSTRERACARERKADISSDSPHHRPHTTRFVRPLLPGASNSPCRPASPVGFAQLSCARRGSRVAAWIPVACAPISSDSPHHRPHTTRFVRPLLPGASNSPCRPASPVGFAQLSCARRGSRVAAWIPVACAPRFPAARLHARAVCLGSRAAHLAQGTR